MRIKWYGHASFLIETGGVRIITDPYDPEVVVGYAPIREPADIVIRSSDDDRGHCNAKMIPGNPTVITATEIIDGGITVRGIHFRAVPVLESVIFKESPLDNAMYCFEAEGIRITHMGDVGNPLDAEQLEALEGTDLLLALTGGPPTIDLDDL
ncbi:MAG: MBL fold metallo-hydrolase, partial [Acidobacteria bacterium]|nr:MBL fold metallo-hydrolase [Acidobacteriota bacterium]